MYYYNVLTLDSTYFSRILGKKRYELTNHLGNVMVTISDKKTAVSSGNPFIADYYLPDIKSAQDFYPFGSVMPKRNFSLNSYRFAFNGKERDDEVKGAGNSYDFGERMYDPRVGRWLSVDPLADMYASHSPYMFVGDNPIFSIDQDGQIIDPYSKKWGFGWFSWTSYPYFSGGLLGSHGETFHNIKTKMINSSIIFKNVYTQLEKSDHHYRFAENNITQGGVPCALRRRNPEANGSFDSKGHKGTSKDPYVINLNYDQLKKGISGYNSQSTIFEETFHAGQKEFYEKTSDKISGIDKEVEAKVVKAFEGFDSRGEFNYEGFDAFKKAFKNGTATESQFKSFNNAVNKFAEGISVTYMKYQMSQGMSKEEAQKEYGYGAFTGKFKYAESLYKKKLHTKNNGSN